MRLTHDDKALLQLAVALQGWYVEPANIVSAGKLVGLGYLRADQHYDEFNVYATDAGEKLALRLKLVRPSPRPLGPYDSPLTFTGTGWLRDEKPVAP